MLSALARDGLHFAVRWWVDWVTRGATTEAAMTFKELALPMIARGVPVDVVQPLGKACFSVGRRGTLDPNKIEEWNDENPEYNVACVGYPEGVVILDCDSPGLPARIEEETGHKLPLTFTVKSAGKGCAHLYFRQTDVSRRLGNKRGADGQSKLFDLQSDGQYVVGPNSRLKKEDGTVSTYELYRDVPIVDFPEWLESWILRYPDNRTRSGKGGDQTAVERVVDRYLEILEPEDMFGIPDLVFGDVHNTLKSIGAYLIDENRDWDEIAGLLTRLGQEYGHRAPEKKDTEDLVKWFKTHYCEPMNLEPRNLPYPKFVYSVPGKHCIAFPTQEAFDAGVAKILLEEFKAPPEGPKNWQALFHTYEELRDAPPVKFAIDGFLQQEGITILGALPAQGKTLVALAMCKALLEGTPLFGHFNVSDPAERVVYLIPESGKSPFAHRLRAFRLMKHVESKRMFCRTFSMPGNISLTDPLLLEACKGADVFLDTAIRFLPGDESSSSDQRVFAQTLFDLLAAGARTVTGLHHSAKSSETSQFMTLENILRGSGELGAMLCSCWGLRMCDVSRTKLWIQNVKARDYMPCDPFVVEGRPSIDLDGHFKLTHEPSLAGEMSEHLPRRGNAEGRPRNEKAVKHTTEILNLHVQGVGTREIGRRLGVPKSTVSRLITENAESVGGTSHPSGDGPPTEGLL